MNRSIPYSALPTPRLAITQVALTFVALWICLAIWSTSSSFAGDARFRRGDFNVDARYDIADPVRTLEYLFLAGGTSSCLEAGDVNDDGVLDIADALFSLGHLFLGGPSPAAPFESCGEDPTEDSLGCIEYRHCRVPNISERAGHCGGVPATEYPNSLQPGDDLHRVTLDAPNAICNDGTPAVMYIRSAPAESPNADRWVFYFQGGGGCSSFEDCLARWCGRQSSAYNESKMSSLYCPESIGGTGMFRRDGFEDIAPEDNVENSFGDFNQVFLYYCSSDSWAGRKSDSVLVDPEDPSKRYSMHFQGHRIVEAALERLMPGGVESDDGHMSVPALADAEFALITGFSAGSGGVATNLDWMASRLEENGTIVRGVRDSSFFPRPETHPDPAEGVRVAEVLEEIWREAWDTRLGPNGLLDSFVDESAREMLAGNDNEWRLADKSYISHNHITTPTFVRIDLLDRSTRQRFAEFGVSTRDFAAMMEATLRGVPSISDHAIEGSSIAQRWSSYAPMCGNHVGLMSDTSFFRRTVDDDTGTPRTYHDTLLRWLQGSTVLVVDDPRNPTTTCGE